MFIYKHIEGIRAQVGTHIIPQEGLVVEKSIPELDDLVTKGRLTRSGAGPNHDELSHEQKIATMKVEELAALCAEKGLDSKGSKRTLIKRLLGK